MPRLLAMCCITMVATRAAGQLAATSARDSVTRHKANVEVAEESHRLPYRDRTNRIRIALPVPVSHGDQLQLAPWVAVETPQFAGAYVGESAFHIAPTTVPPEPAQEDTQDNALGGRVAFEEYALPAADLDVSMSTPDLVASSDDLAPSFAENVFTDWTGVSGTETVAPVFQDIVERPQNAARGVLDWFTQSDGPFLGLGYQRLPLALFEMDIAKPNRAMRLRLAAAYDHQFPDRAEYFWAKAPDGRGLQDPRVETSVNYQELRLQMETGGERATVLTELPLRMLDPEFNANTTGLADMSVGAKTVLKDGDDWTLSQIFRTYINTGAITHGLSTGHISMEPGLLFSTRHGRRGQIHAELKYWFPIAGDPDHSGQILRYGLGMSRILRESDCFAIIPTLEVVGFTILDGRKTATDLIGLPSPVEVDGETIVNLYPGIWIVKESSQVWEFGISGGFPITGEQFFGGMLRADLRMRF